MKFKIDHNSNTPLHIQTEEFLRSLISQEEYKQGKLLPKELDLVKQLKVSRNTLRQAINTLVVEGLLIRKKGYGTKVAKRVLSEASNWMSFSQEMKALGIEVYNYELNLKWVFPSTDMAKFFNIKDKSKSKILQISRLRGRKEYPFVYYVSALNPAMGLTGNEDFNRPLYKILENDYNIVVKRSYEEISAGDADEFLAEKLEINLGDSILIRKRYVSDINNMPVEYNIGYYRADSFTYTIECFRK